MSNHCFLYPFPILSLHIKAIYALYSSETLRIYPHAIDVLIFSALISFEVLYLVFPMKCNATQQAADLAMRVQSVSTLRLLHAACCMQHMYCAHSISYFYNIYVSKYIRRYIHTLLEFTFFRASVYARYWILKIMFRY